MTYNSINSALRNPFFNIVKIFAILISYRIFSGAYSGIPLSRSMSNELKGSFSKYLNPIAGSIKNNMGSAAYTVATGAVIPLFVGYSVRRFEEQYNFMGRGDGFSQHIRQDLPKMAHYAFHMCTMAALSWSIWKLTVPLKEDMRVASLVSALYFYAVGRTYLMDPAESNLMIRLRYLPALCFAIIGFNRSPALRAHLPVIAASSSIATSVYMMGFQ